MQLRKISSVPHVAVESFSLINVPLTAVEIAELKVTRPSFFGGGYYPTLKLSGFPTFTFIASLTHRMDNI